MAFRASKCLVAINGTAAVFDSAAPKAKASKKDAAASFFDGR
jgi:hypothetical protein